MIISRMIDKLKDLQKHYGDDVEVYFDCPRCDMSFTPNLVVSKTIHLKAEKLK